MLATLLLALLITLPLAASEPIIVGGSGPVRGSWLLVPQLHCEIVADEPGLHVCKAVGPGHEVNQLRLRSSGPGHVVAFMDSEENGVRMQVASLDCYSSCIAPMPKAVTSPRLLLYVYSEAPPNTLVSVTAEFGLATARL